jgi:ribosome-associated translation inhibitor RaiA
MTGKEIMDAYLANPKASGKREPTASAYLFPTTEGTGASVSVHVMGHCIQVTREARNPNEALSLASEALIKQLQKAILAISDYYPTQDAPKEA